MHIVQRTTIRWLVTVFITICIAGVCVGLYFRSAFRPVPPLLDVTEKRRDFYGPIFHTYSPAQKAHVLDGEFLIVKTVDHLPNDLKSAFSRLVGIRDFAMANPGEKYQETDVRETDVRETDVIVDEGLPFERLLFAGISSDKYFIHYEKGGIGHSYHVAVFGIDSEGKVEFLWGGPGTRGAEDLRQLRAMVAAGVFKDDRAYYW